MTDISLADAKAQLSALIGRVEAGEEVRITKRGKPVAVLKPLRAAPQMRDLSFLKEASDFIRDRCGKSESVMAALRDDARY